MLHAGELQPKLQPEGPGPTRRLKPRTTGDPLGVLVLVTTSGPPPGHLAAPCPVQTPPPNSIAAEPDGRRVLSRVGVADHAVTLKAPWTGSGWREYFYGGFGGGHPHFHPHADLSVTQVLLSGTVSLGIGTVRACMWPDLRRGLAASDRERPSFTRANGTLMARRPTAELA
jgi:hypothetical protein